MDEYYKRSGQIPAFGNWDIANELPITQYFENARQAGLIRHRSSSAETNPYLHGDNHDHYAVDLKKPAPKATRIKDRRYTNATMVKDKETRVRKQWKVYDVKEHPRKQTMNNKKTLHVNDVVCSGLQLPSKQHPKPVDEDLYKIPPELLRTTKRKKMLGFIPKCLVPAACVS
ncbi:unnamed protein product [Vicia faba]|uniref:RIN4 pathogenic type III effector avirulence factor Avr cleavage site domain-containing protein n=1 Tax=Vicia faba TaxID=3906 RepID=A0AAV1B2L1_VICFA|nr:unnamed protein product [Vicia faba]